MIGGRRKPLVNTSPNPIRNYQEESSPTKASILIRSDCSEYVNGLKAKKENYSTAFSLYTACYDNGLPQKCLKHLNFVTLYCADEHKLLCVNCLYGSTAHKNHSVTPSNSCLSEVRKDNEVNIRVLDEQIKSIRQSQVKVHENKRIIESQSSFILQQITRQFVQMRKIIDAKQRQLKERAARQFERASFENDITRKEVAWWKEQMGKMRNSLPRDGNNEEAEIYKHLVLQLMLNQKLQSQKLTYVPSKDQMEQEYLNQAKQLKEFIKARIDDGSKNYYNKMF